MVWQTLKRWSSAASHGGSGDLKPDVTEAELKKIYAKASTQSFPENPRYAFHPTGGVMPMNIKGRFANERERLGPDFNETQRQWRIKWIQDQHLHPDEPFPVKQLYIEYHNRIRRFYRWPLDKFEDWLATKKSLEMNANRAMIVRKLIGRGALIYFGVLWMWYYVKYNHEHWEKERGPRIYVQKETVYPGDVRFPRPDPRTESWNYADKGFHNRKVLLNN